MKTKDTASLRPLLFLLFPALLLIGAAAGRATAPAPPPREETQEVYVIGEYQGMLAVFDADDPSLPLQITDIPLTELRRLDADEIRKGIRLEGEEALAQALEDYIS